MINYKLTVSIPTVFIEVIKFTSWFHNGDVGEAVVWHHISTDIVNPHKIFTVCSLQGGWAWCSVGTLAPNWILGSIHDFDFGHNDISRVEDLSWNLRKWLNRFLPCEKWLSHYALVSEGEHDLISILMGVDGLPLWCRTVSKVHFLSLFLILIIRFC